MREKLTVEISVEAANLVLMALSNLPYAQVHALIHDLQEQIGPQLIAMERERRNAPASQTGQPD